MRGTWMGNEVHVPAGEAGGLVEAGYGRLREDELVLSPIEACYLVHKGRLELYMNGRRVKFERLLTTSGMKDPMFELRYMVYRDLRERGYYVGVQAGAAGAFFLYERGVKPTTAPSTFVVYVVGERDPITLEWMLHRLEQVRGIRKRMVLAVVDEDGDLTYYTVDEVHLRDGEPRKPPAARATLLQDRAFVWDAEESRGLFEHGMYGTLLDEQTLQLSLIEMLYLAQKRVLEVHDASGHPLPMEKLESILSHIDEEGRLKLKVYRELRERGCVPKSGYKFGSHFRVYEVPHERHSTYLVHALSSSHVLTPPELSRAVRLAHSVHKRMVFACDNGKYIEMGWFRP